MIFKDENKKISWNYDLKLYFKYNIKNKVKLIA
jgi:hypothetical protein